MKRSTTFGTDQHTHAGRRHLIDMMIRHKRRLADIAAGKREKTQGRELYNGMNTTLTLDNTTPRSYRYSHRETPGAKRQAAWKAELALHSLTLTKLHSRIAAYPSTTDRRANVFDPVAHPVQFKRTEYSSGDVLRTSHRPRSTKEQVERDVMYSTGARRTQRYYYADPFSNLLKPRQDYDSAMLITQQMPRRRSPHPTSSHRSPSPTRPSTAGGRPRTARVKPRTDRPQPLPGAAERPQTAQPMSRTQPLPSADGLSEDGGSDEDEEGGVRGPYERLYATVLGLLLSHRIFRTEHVEAMLERAMEVNDHLDRDRMEAVCEAVREEMRLKEPAFDEAEREERRRTAWRDSDTDDDTDEEDSAREDAASPRTASATPSQASISPRSPPPTTALPRAEERRVEARVEAASPEASVQPSRADSPRTDTDVSEAPPAPSEVESEYYDSEHEAANDAEDAAATPEPPLMHTASTTALPLVDEGDEDEYAADEDYADEAYEADF